MLDAAITDGWGDPYRPCAPTSPSTSRWGDVLLARTCRDLLGRAGAPAPRNRGITAWEAEVLGLVAEGLTNVQVAERQLLSPRTVDTHVANLLAKAGRPGPDPAAYLGG